MADERLEALCAVAKAYYDRGVFVQYDERFLNRSGSVRAERRQKGSAPEYATRQNTLHLDCSSFVYSVYYQTFGIKLEADLTEQMVELENIRKFYYVIRGDETEEQKKRILDEFMSVLQPGDAIINRNKGEENGHIMLYIGDGKILHCTAPGGGSYDYAEKHDRHEVLGGICYMDIGALLFPVHKGEESKRFFFHPRISRFGILRPYGEGDSVMPNARARVLGLRDIMIEKYCSVNPGRSVLPGECITYYINAANLSAGCKTVSVRDRLSEKTELCGGSLSFDAVLAPCERRTFTYTVRVKDGACGVIEADGLTVNGASIAVLSTLIGGHLDCGQKEKLVSAAKTACSCKWEFAKKVYKAIGVELPCSDTAEVFSEMFRKSAIDTQVVIPDTCGRVRSMLVPNMYGGKNAETNYELPCVRIREPREACFDVGDIVIFAETEDMSSLGLYIYIGNSSFASPDGVITGADAYAMLDSLLGQYAFFVIRPTI